jgi:DNA end-binding protein Ku
MPRASWRGFLRLSLVTCPVYLSPATTGTKPIRLHQLWQPAPVEVNEDALPDRSAGQQGSASSAPQLAADHTNPEAAQSRAATRIALRPHDPGTGEEIDKREIVKGYEYGRGQFVTLTPEELKALDVEARRSSISKSLRRGATWIRSISTPHTTFIQTAQSRSKRCA